MDSKEITLFKYEPSDFETYHSLVKEDDVMRYITGKGLSTQQAKAKFDYILNLNEKDKIFGYFKIFNRENILIGDCKLDRSKYDGAILEIGYLLKKEFWGMGYGTLICEKLLHLVEREAPELDVMGIIDPDNIASKKLLQKFNFESYFLGIEDGLPTEKLILKRN